MIELNSGITKYRYLECFADLLSTDKSRYFAQPRPIIVKYSGSCRLLCSIVMSKLWSHVSPAQRGRVAKKCFRFDQIRGKCWLVKNEKIPMEVAKEVLKEQMETNMIEKKTWEKDGICFLHSRPYVDKLLSASMCNKTIKKWGFFLKWYPEQSR